jgi:hypothetical protein
MSYERKNMRYALGFIASVLMCGTAQAGFVFLDSGAPIGSAAVSVPGINNFQSQLSANGVSEYFLGRTLGVTGAQLGDSIEVDFFAAEAGYWNIFTFGAVTISNRGNQAWAERDRGSVAASNGLQNFQFCSVDVLSCLTNSANDASQIGSFQSIGMYLTNNANTAWLLWDDSGANVDDNHDDLIVRLTYRSSVPEPGSLALLGLGLAGVALFRRKRVTA